MLAYAQPVQLVDQRRLKPKCCVTALAKLLTTLWMARLIDFVLHLSVPALAAFWAPPSRRVRVWWLMVATLAVDLDHLLATPVYDPARCSIGVHPLHHPLAILAYAALLPIPVLRWPAVGLLLHMGIDGLGCLLI
jgi:hypothetical protein